jgi:hypothetical protein
MMLNTGPLRRPKINVYRSMRGLDLDDELLRTLVRRYGQRGGVWVDTRRSAVDTPVDRPKSDPP